MKNVEFWICFILLLEFTFGLSFSQKYKTYTKYQKSTTLYLVLLFVSFLLSLIPVSKILEGNKLDDTMYCFIPLVWLILFKVIDQISLVFNNRPIFIATKWDNDLNKRNWLDVLLSITAFLTTIFSPIFIDSIYKTLKQN